MKHKWKHKTHVFKEDDEWWWTCLLKDCRDGVHPSFATALRHALRHTFIGGILPGDE